MVSSQLSLRPSTPSPIPSIVARSSSCVDVQSIPHFIRMQYKLCELQHLANCTVQSLQAEFVSSINFFLPKKISIHVHVCVWSKRSHSHTSLFFSQLNVLPPNQNQRDANCKSETDRKNVSRFRSSDSDCCYNQKGMMWLVLESYPATQLLPFTLKILSSSDAICRAAAEHPLCISSSSLVSPPSHAAAASTARRSRYRWHTAQSTDTAASAPPTPAFIILDTTAGTTDRADSHTAARPSAHPTVASSTRSAWPGGPASASRTRTAAATAPSRTIAARARRVAATAARHDIPAATACPSRLPFFSSAGPTRRTSSRTRSSDSATAARAPGAALRSSDSTSLAASTRASSEVPLRSTRARDAAADGASAASAAATRLLLSSSMQSDAAIAASTRTAASAASLSALRSTNATVSAAPPALASAFLSNSSTSSSERKAASFRSGGQGSAPGSAIRRRSSAAAAAGVGPTADAAGDEEEGAAVDAQSAMRRRRVRLGTRSVEGSVSMVAGQVVLPESSQRWMEARS
uniref:Uncharacterized protein n=1 Tax=Zea mays TaxID=4577 RepID=A0A804NRZ2_MAIZE